jgi:signal peptidase II
LTRQQLQLPLGAMALTLLADLSSKAAIQSHFQLGESLPLLPGLWFTYVMNPGAAFSLLAAWGSAFRLPFFIILTLAALGFMAYYLRSLDPRDRLSALALGLVAGGALGNLLDRLRFGQVVDFIEVGVRGVYTWPIFNVADSAVCIGVGLLVWRIFKAVK